MRVGGNSALPTNLTLQHTLEVDKLVIICLQKKRVLFLLSLGRFVKLHFSPSSHNLLCAYWATPGQKVCSFILHIFWKIYVLCLRLLPHLHILLFYSLSINYSVNIPWCFPTSPSTLGLQVLFHNCSLLYRVSNIPGNCNSSFTGLYPF